MKDHEIQKIVSDLKNIAIKFGHAQQLREQIGNYIVPILKDAKPDYMTDKDWKAEQELSEELAKDEIADNLRQKIAAIIVEACMHEARAIDCAKIYYHQCGDPVYPINPFEYADRILKEIKNEQIVLI